ncbi:uncharacterized protein ACIBXB_002232 isoform 2-T2 [Morphnus guianensis]
MKERKQVSVLDKASPKAAAESNSPPLETEETQTRYEPVRDVTDQYPWYLLGTDVGQETAALAVNAASPNRSFGGGAGAGKESVIGETGPSLHLKPPTAITASR